MQTKKYTQPGQDMFRILPSDDRLARRRKIRMIMISKNLDVSKVAELVNRSRSWTSQVLYDNAKSDPIRNAIAKVFGMDAKDLWP